MSEILCIVQILKQLEKSIYIYFSFWYPKQEEKMTRRNNFAKRCAMIQILLFITILISFARVINAPKKLLAEPSIERTFPNFHTLESRSDDNVLATDVLVDNKNDGVDGTAAKKDMEEAVSENKAVLDDTKIPLKDDNPSKNENSNKTEANNNTQIIIPESCKDLEMIYSNDEEADSKWWKTVHTMKGQSLHILHISLQC